MPTVSGPILCLDIGNTRVHAGIFRNGKLSPLSAYPTRAWVAGEQIGPNAWKAAEPTPAAIACASVVPAALPAVEQLAREWKLPLFVLRHDQVKTLDFDYPHPQEIGADRLANAVAALHLTGAPAVVIDIGTAVTFEVLAEPHTFIGGVIAPGPDLLAASLTSGTAALPAVELPAGNHSLRAIGRSTVEAMESGCLLGFEGMLRHLHQSVCVELNRRSPQPVHTLITGGGFSALRGEWKHTLRHEPHLTLLGVGLAGVAASQWVQG